MSKGGIIIEEDNTDKFLEEITRRKRKIHEMIGVKGEKYAKALCPVGTSESTGRRGYRGGTLRNSITHVADDEKVEIGTNVEYGPYVELGTGPHFQAPPEWEQFESSPGSGIGHAYVRPRPFIRPAVADHLDEYRSIIEDELSG